MRSEQGEARAIHVDRAGDGDGFITRSGYLPTTTRTWRGRDHFMESVTIFPLHFYKKLSSASRNVPISPVSRGVSCTSPRYVIPVCLIVRMDVIRLTFRALQGVKGHLQIRPRNDMTTRVSV